MDVARVIEAPHERLWQLLTQVGYWPQWGPSVKAVRCDVETISLGTTGLITTAVGISVPFEVTHFEYGYRWDWAVAKLPATGHRLERVDARRSRVVFEVPSWALPYRLVCQRALERIEGLV